MAYIGQEPGQGQAERFIFTASGGETAVSVDDDSLPLSYTENQVSVYLNGVKLVVGTDCIATNGSTITGLAALTAADVVEVIALSAFSPADTVPKSGGTFTGAVTVASPVINTAVSGTAILDEDNLASDSATKLATQQSIKAYVDAKPEYNDDVIQTNIALLAFKTAVNGSLAKYNLQDQVIDEYTDATGIDGTPSTNHVLTAGVYGGVTSVSPTGGDTVTTGVPSGYNVRKFDNTSSTETLVVPSGATGTVDILVVGGGGSGGGRYGGGGGAGGLVWKTGHTLTANTYNAVIGDGGAATTASTGNEGGHAGDDSTWSINGGATQFTAKGGGGGGSSDSIAADNGGSGGGRGIDATAGGTTTQAGTSQGVTPTTNIGYNGGAGSGSPHWATGGGGGSGGAGGTGADGQSGVGGIGTSFASQFGTSVGDSGVFASGGGGGFTTDGGGNTAGGTGVGGGGGTGGATSPDNGSDSSAAQSATGGGSGGGSGGGNGSNSGKGGSGVILVRWADGQFTSYNDITLQSTDTTAEAVPTKADMVMLMEDAAGTATLNTDIKGYVSRDSGSTFIEGVLVDEGDWGTNKRILAFHDLSFTGASGTAMCYKITTHNQAIGKQTKIHATSIGWR